MLKIPSVGQSVWCWPSPLNRLSLMIEHDQPCAGVIAFAHSDTSVNVFVVGHNGVTRFFNRVFLRQFGERPPADENYCEWPVT